MTVFAQRLTSISSLTILIIIVVLRASLLNYSDLVDPTESRYASVAQLMILDNDWITPKLPQPEGVVPYLGKPPLHFWLTALSYKALGFSNFSSRLPSLIATISILVFVIIFGRRFFDFETANLSALITISTALLFFLSGASVIDVTLSACFCAALLCFSIYLDRPSRKIALALGASLALGFLTKGPVILALFLFAVIPFLIIRKETRRLINFHWGYFFIAFFVIITPWFVISEIENPGLLKYFFWNENLARYLIRDYGDRYGDGHVYPRGTSWLMLLQAFMPWSIVMFFYLTKKSSRNSLVSDIKSNKWLLLCLCWGLSPAVFFTLGRQLHVSYLLPGIPGLSLLLARWIKIGLNSEQKKFLINSISSFAFLSGIGIALAAIFYGVAWQLILLALLGYCIIFYIYNISSAKLALEILPYSILQIIFVFLIALVLSTPIVNVRKSSNSILNKIASQSSESNIRIGVVTENNYSPYWLSKKLESEGNPRFKIEYISNSPIQKDPPKNLILKKGSEVNLAPQIFSQYELKAAIDRWRWYQIKQPLLP